MRRKNAQKLIAAGAIVTVGTDNYWAAAPEFSRTPKPETQDHGIGTIIAIEGLVELGMTPMQAIVSATRHRRVCVARSGPVRNDPGRQARRSRRARRRSAGRHSQPAEGLGRVSRRSIDRPRAVAGNTGLVAGAGTAAAFRNPAARALIERRFPLKDEPATCYAFGFWPASTSPQLLLAFVVLISSLTFHEAAHAWTANRLGDSTARHARTVVTQPGRPRRPDRNDRVSAAGAGDRRAAARLGQASAGRTCTTSGIRGAISPSSRWPVRSAI